MLVVENAKRDLLNRQTDGLLRTLARHLDVDRDDLSLRVAAELEFYIMHGEAQLAIDSLKIKEIKNFLFKYKYNGLRLESFEEEDGVNQFEVQFFPTERPIELAKNIEDFRNVILDVADADFRAKPFADQPGSSIHFHISLYYKGENLFSKDNPRDDDEYHYMPLYWSIAGMLEWMLPAMRIFAPTQNCYDRYLYPKDGQKYIHYPTGCCWGFNNRTCALRIPIKPTEDPYNCRIEHRVASSLSDPYLDMFAIFSAMQHGIANELECPEPVFGNSFDDAHDFIPQFPKTLAESEHIFYNGVFANLKELI